MGGRPTTDSLQVQPGPSWRPLLLGPAHYNWLHALLAHVHMKPELPVAQNARQLVVGSLCIMHSCMCTVRRCIQTVLCPGHMA